MGNQEKIMGASLPKTPAKFKFFLKKRRIESPNQQIIE